jgi:hypothetical protein
MTNLIDDIAQYLVDDGLGTISTDIFISYMPDATDNALSVLDTGGPLPDPDIPTHSPTFQVFIRAENYTLGKAKLDAVRDALHRIGNEQIGGTYFYYILAQSEGGHIGRNERGLDEFSINFIALTR